MKISIAGKGGVGKTTITAALSLAFAKKNKKVIAIDADPDSNLLSALGVPKTTREKVTPLSEMYNLIEERTGARPGSSYGALFCLTPKVDDLLDRYGIKIRENLTALVLGTIKAGQGCFCPENALLRALIDHLLKERKEIVLLDMEAGLEHLGRGSIKNIDALFVIVEPGMKSIETAERIKTLANDLGIKRIYTIINKIKNKDQEKIIKEKIKKLGLPIIGVLPFDDTLQTLDLNDQGISPDTLLFKKIEKITTNLNL